MGVKNYAECGFQLESQWQSAQIVSDDYRRANVLESGLAPLDLG
jgi:hypothetical protein